MSLADQIVEGELCMKCHEWLISEDGRLCDAGHPVFCKRCWERLPAKERRDGAPFFDPSGEMGAGAIYTRVD